MGDAAEIIGLQEETMATVVTGVEMSHKTLDEGMAVDTAGILLRGINREQVQRGMVLAKPKSIHGHNKFMSEVYVLKRKRRRHKPFFPGYRPQFYIAAEHDAREPADNHRHQRGGKAIRAGRARARRMATNCSKPTFTISNAELVRTSRAPSENSLTSTS